MPGRRGGGGYDKFQERLNKLQTNQAREEERQRKEQEDRRAFDEWMAKNDEEIRQSMLDMSPYQREQVRQNDEGFLRRWGIRDSRRTSVPSAEDRLEQLRKDAEERARQDAQERYEAGLQAQREALERQHQLEAARRVQYEETMNRLAAIRANIAIERGQVRDPEDYR